MRLLRRASRLHIAVNAVTAMTANHKLQSLGSLGSHSRECSDCHDCQDFVVYDWHDWHFVVVTPWHAGGGAHALRALVALVFLAVAGC